VKNISVKNFEFPHLYYKYLWLLGQFVQHSLLYLQGIDIPEPPELKSLYPDKSPAELINLHRDLYGCKFNWKTGMLIVKYGKNQFDISIEAKEIIINNVSDKLSDCIGFDDRGFDFNRACKSAIRKIIELITNGQKQPI